MSYKISFLMVIMFHFHDCIIFLYLFSMVTSLFPTVGLLDYKTWNVHPYLHLP